MRNLMKKYLSSIWLSLLLGLLLIGCTEEEINTVYEFHNDSEFMKGILIRKG